MKIEETLNGGYKGLYGEVVTHDCYKVKNLPFVPDVVFDIGANIGVFTRYARELWPHTRIVSVEPHPENYSDFMHFTYPELLKYSESSFYVINAALGHGQLWHNKGAVNGSGESYVSSGLGFDPEKMANATSTEKSSIKTIMLDELINSHWKKAMKSVIKIDCEGGENVIWDHAPSMKALAQMDYITIETHFYALHGGELYDQMKEKTIEALNSLKSTHVTFFEHPHFRAIKKKYELP
jgi:FkbM family methyltransferase